MQKILIVLKQDRHTYKKLKFGVPFLEDYYLDLFSSRTRLQLRVIRTFIDRFNPEEFQNGFFQYDDATIHNNLNFLGKFYDDRLIST